MKRLLCAAAAVVCLSSAVHAADIDKCNMLRNFSGVVFEARDDGESSGSILGSIYSIGVDIDRDMKQSMHDVVEATYELDRELFSDDLTYYTNKHNWGDYVFQVCMSEGA